MPYTRPEGGFERASRLGQVDMAKSEVVRAAMARWETPAVATEPPADLQDRLVSLADLPAPGRPDTTYALAFDGSIQEVAAREEYPSVRVDYLQLAGVAVVLSKFLSAWDGPFVDPKKQAAAVGSQILNAVLPGSNVSSPGSSSFDTWRQEVHELFRTRGVSDFGETVTLLDALDRLFGSTGCVEVGYCPVEGCDQRRLPVPLRGGSCPGCGAQVWPTDVLRTHEEFNPDGSNLTPLGRLMSVCERLLMTIYVDGMLTATPESLTRGLFITDGPLALFGTVAPLKRRIVDWLGSVTSRLTSLGLQPPLVVGIEKSGAFVDHAAAISGWIPTTHVLHMNDQYIRDHIARRAPGADPYGKDEFYGRKFVYKTSTEQLLVVTVPRATGQPYAEAGCEDLAGYPTLKGALEVLDTIQTRLYAHAVIPVALAHSAAALPLGTGTRVLQDLAKQALSV
jgi:hypothetical protein